MSGGLFQSKTFQDKFSQAYLRDLPPQFRGNSLIYKANIANPQSDIGISTSIGRIMSQLAPPATDEATIYLVIPIESVQKTPPEVFIQVYISTLNIVLNEKIPLPITSSNTFELTCLKNEEKKEEEQIYGNETVVVFNFKHKKK